MIVGLGSRPAEQFEGIAESAKGDFAAADEGGFALAGEGEGTVGEGGVDGGGGGLEVGVGEGSEGGGGDGVELGVDGVGFDAAEAGDAPIEGGELEDESALELGFGVEIGEVAVGEEVVFDFAFGAEDGVLGVPAVFVAVHAGDGLAALGAGAGGARFGGRGLGWWLRGLGGVVAGVFLFVVVNRGHRPSSPANSGEGEKGFGGRISANECGSRKNKSGAAVTGWRATPQGGDGSV